MTDEQTVETVTEVGETLVSGAVSWWAWAMQMLGYIQSTFVSIVFFLLFISLLIWIVKLNVGNGQYQNFRLADMVRRKDGTIDRKAMERAMLFLATLYGFLFVVHKHPDMIIGYLVAMAGIWLGYQVADNKLPSLGKPPETPTPAAPAPGSAP